VERSKVKFGNQHSHWKRSFIRFDVDTAGCFGTRKPHGGSAADGCISRIMTPRDRSPFTAGKMGAGRTKAREILHARHDFPHYCREIQLLMDKLPL
jgi:hypothetical protein